MSDYALWIYCYSESEYENSHVDVKIQEISLGSR